MATTTKFYLDTRSVRVDGTSPLKLVIHHNGQCTHLSLSVYLVPSQWDARSQRVSSHPNKLFLNGFLARRRADVEAILLRLSESGRIGSMSIRSIKEAVANELTPSEAPVSGSFFSWFNKFIATKSGRTRELYSLTLGRLEKFCIHKLHASLSEVSFDDVTRDWLSSFDAFLAETSPSRNARNIHLRNIRAVFNFAIDEEATVCYPFRRFKLKNEETRKRALTLKQLRLISSAQLPSRLVKYRDMFMLVFYLCGINVIDLCSLSGIVAGRIEYKRAKTHRLYSIKVEPEAMALIQKLQGRGQLLHPLDTYVNYRDYYRHFNSALHEIATLLGIPVFSTYWARHTWATLARRAGVSVDDIALALGHGDKDNKVTRIYIDEDLEKVDAANRRVIDFILSGKK